MRSFTYTDRNLYAGRDETITRAVNLLTDPGAERNLLFITGSSGSGKSSLAMAGILPALEQYYNERKVPIPTARAVLRPSRQPLTQLAAALSRLGLPIGDLMGDSQPLIGSSKAFNRLVSEKTPPSQVNLIVLDQFEELFTQSAPDQRDMLFDILSNLPSLAGLRTHIIATMRSDYLPELFAHSDLYNIAKQGIDLRAMSIKELKEALQRPLQATYPDGKKQWEPALVDRLAQDTAPDAAYLPLLQVTLEDIWDKGRLTLDQYETLGNAIEERANRIFACKSAGTPQQTERSITPNDCPDGQEARSPQEQAMILQLLLSLVNVSLDDDPRRDVRRRRLKADLVDHQPEHERLIDELVTARLLSVTIETQGDSQVEMVDIIHETLIGNWDRLQQAIKEKRLELQQRTRFDQALQEWLANNRSDKYLLPEVRLAEARELDKRGDVALRDPAARSLLTLSNAQQTKKQQQEVDRLRKTIVAIAFVALLALAAVVFAVILGQQAVDARDQATAAESTALTEATRAVKAESTAEAEAIRAVKAESTALAEATRAVKAESTALAEATRAVKAESTA
ncbi:MAG: hypothetical protein WCD37_14410, partial [Chloroflexia bacterium]